MWTRLHPHCHPIVCAWFRHTTFTATDQPPFVMGMPVLLHQTHRRPAIDCAAAVCTTGATFRCS